MMSIINNAYANVVSSFFSAKFQRHVEELLVSPMPNSIILLGFVSGGVARGATVGLAVTAVAALLSDLRVENRPDGGARFALDLPVVAAEEVRA